MPARAGSPSRAVRALAWIGFLALLILHLDFWRPRGSGIWFGWMPEELAWRLGWIVLAVGYLLFFTTAVWRERGQD